MTKAAVAARTAVTIIDESRQPSADEARPAGGKLTALLDGSGGESSTGAPRQHNVWRDAAAPPGTHCILEQMQERLQIAATCAILGLRGEMAEWLKAPAC